MCILCILLTLLLWKNKAFLITLRGFWHAIWCCYQDWILCFSFTPQSELRYEKKQQQQQTNHVSEYLLFVSECSRSQGQEAFSWVVGYIFT